MTSREDLGRLAYAAYCDMAGRPAVWAALGPRAQAAWAHAAITVRDRLYAGIAHAYRPEDQRQEEGTMALPRSTAHGGSEEPHVTSTDDAELYTRQRAAGNDDIEWVGEGIAPGAEAPKNEDSDAAPAEAEQGKPKRHIRPSASQRDKR